jgi:hypothetical protein
MGKDLSFCALSISVAWLLNSRMNEHYLFLYYCITMALKPGSTEHRTLYATMAKAAYENSEKRAIMAQSGYIMDTNRTNRNRLVYVNPTTKDVVVSFRGTNLKSENKYGDLGADLLYALNLRELSSRFCNAERAAKEIESAYPGYTYTSTGHSLGAGQALYVNKKRSGWKAVTYSAHTPYSTVTREALHNQKDVTNYVVPIDPIANSTWMTGQAVSVKQTQKDPHSIDNFIN